MKNYSEDYLLPKITSEVTIKYNSNNPRTSLWQTLYKNNPKNYWCKIFASRMREAKIEDIKNMIDMGSALEEELANIINKNISPEGLEADRVLGFLIRHLEFFHKMDEHFYDTLIELCERAEDFDKQLPWLDILISQNPNFLKENPLIGMLSKKYNGIILKMLVLNKDKILKGEYSVLP